LSYQETVDAGFENGISMKQIVPSFGRGIVRPAAAIRLRKQSVSPATIEETTAKGFHYG
jgi:hypothetical protein